MNPSWPVRPAVFTGFKNWCGVTKSYLPPAALVAAALIIGMGVSTRLFFLEKAARQRAVAAEQQAEMARANEAELRRLAETREKITQATVLINQEKFDEADQLMSGVSVTQPTVEGAAVLRALGEYHALKNQWKEAADRFKALLQIDQLDGWDVRTLDYLEMRPDFDRTGRHRDGYEHFRHAAIARFTGGNNPFADRIVKISLLLPANEKLMKALQPLAERHRAIHRHECGCHGRHFSGGVAVGFTGVDGVSQRKFRKGGGMVPAKSELSRTHRAAKCHGPHHPGHVRSKTWKIRRCPFATRKSPRNH